MVLYQIDKWQKAGKKYNTIIEKEKSSAEGEVPLKDAEVEGKWSDRS